MAQTAVGLAITAFARLTLQSHTPEVVDAVEAKLRAVPSIKTAFAFAVTKPLSPLHIP
ncbi:hypothetical protein [Mycobacterium sp. URHB0021]